MDRSRIPSVLNDLRVVEDSKTDLAYTTESLFNRKWFRRKTRLSGRIISKLSVVDTLAQIWDIDFFKQWIPTYTEYLTSEGGRGRKEIVDIAQAVIKRDSMGMVEVANEKLGRR